MELTVEWEKPLRLTSRNKLLFTAKDDFEDVPKEAGVYFFSRKYGDEYLPFYIGETGSLRKRLKQHLTRVAICDVLRGMAEDSRIKQGTRYFHAGVFKARPGQNSAKCRAIIQHRMIRNAVEEDIPILNFNLTKYATHSMLFTGSPSGRGWYDRKAIVEA